MEVAVDSREASELMNEHGAPAVVVVDLQTGSAGGFALAKDMAQSPELSDVPVIMLLERDADRWLARQAGASRCLVKPLAPGDVAREALDLATNGSAA